MGMFDTIHIDPVMIKESGLCNDERWLKYCAFCNKAEEENGLTDACVPLQFKDLSCVLDNYLLRKNPKGELQLCRYNYTSKFAKSSSNLPNLEDVLSSVEVISTGVKESYTTDTLNAGNIIQTDELDIDIDIQLVIVSGILTEFKVVRFTEYSSAERLNTARLHKQRIRKNIELRKTFKGKVLCIIQKILFKTSSRLARLADFIQRRANGLI